MTAVTIFTDLRPELGVARNQGPRPTCLAFAASDAHAALRLGWAPLSCEFAFYYAQLRSGRAPNSGATLSAMLATLKEEGQPQESDWPYLAATPTDPALWSPPTTVGPRFGRDGALHAAAMDAVIDELNAKQPVILLITLSRSFYMPTPEGVIQPAAGEVPEPARRHAVVAVGCGIVSGQRAILVRNSWGSGWGVAGHGWLTEGFLAPRLFAAAVLTEEVNVSTSILAA